MPVRARLSNSFQAKRSRIQRLPQIIDEMVNAALKKDAVGVIEIFQDGIRRNNFRLAPLSQKTIERKRRQGQAKPNVPLYGRGDDEENSYINVWYLVRTKHGWRVRPRNARHWSGRIKLKDLWKVHEHGATIETPRGVIVIPDRPAWEKAQQRYLKQRLNQETEEEVRAAIRAVMRTGRARPVSRFIRKANQAGREHERRR